MKSRKILKVGLYPIALIVCLIMLIVGAIVAIPVTFRIASDMLEFYLGHLFSK